MPKFLLRHPQQLPEDKAAEITDRERESNSVARIHHEMPLLRHLRGSIDLLRGYKAMWDLGEKREELLRATRMGMMNLFQGGGCIDSWETRSLNEWGSLAGQRQGNAGRGRLRNRLVNVARIA